MVRKIEISYFRYIRATAAAIRTQISCSNIYITTKKRYELNVNVTEAFEPRSMGPFQQSIVHFKQTVLEILILLY